MKKLPLSAPDLTHRPPRSPRVRLGGFVILPRLLDKGRATIAGVNGEYLFNCPLDKRFLEFVGINAAVLRKQLATGNSDSEMLHWVLAKSSTKPGSEEIAAWSAGQEQRVPMDTDSRNFFNQVHAKIAPQREDIATWFDLLDLDDYISYGGKA